MVLTQLFRMEMISRFDMLLKGLPSRLKLLSLDKSFAVKKMKSST